MSLPNLVPNLRSNDEPDPYQFDHAAQFTATITDPGGDTVIFTTDEAGRTIAIRDRRVGDDRRVRTRRLEDHEASRAADRDRLEEIRADKRRAWSMLLVGYVIGLGSAIVMFVATS